MQIEFIASFATITTDPAASRALYVDALGLPLDHAPGDDYIHSEAIGGSKHFGVWPLTQAARACFGGDDWPPAFPGRRHASNSSSAKALLTSPDVNFIRTVPKRCSMQPEVSLEATGPGS